MNDPVLICGLACVIAAIIGGGLKAWGLEIPLLSSTKRQLLLGTFGLLLLFLVLGRDSFNTVTSPSPDRSDPSVPRPVTRGTRAVHEQLGIPLHGEPTVYTHGSSDPDYEHAAVVFAGIASRQGIILDQIEVIKWNNIDETEADQFAKAILWELRQRGYSYSYSPAEVGPLDPRRKRSWVFLFDLRVAESAIGYWGLSYQGGGSYSLLWAWTLIP